MIRSSSIVLAALLFAWPAPVVGQERAVQVSPRYRFVEYHPSELVVLKVAPGYQIGVEFEAGERIESVALGSSDAWDVTPSQRGDHLFLKVLVPGVSTNMTVITDRRTYLFDLQPIASPTADMAYVVRFAFPDALQSSELSTYRRWGYRLSGSRALRPTAMTDDGVRTYIEWSMASVIPAIFAIDGSGRERLVNGVVRDGVLVIDAVAPRLRFRAENLCAEAVRRELGN